MLKKVAIGALCLLLGVPVAMAAVLTANWINATTNTDGSAIPASGPGSIASTVIEWGTCNGDAFGTKLGEKTVAGSVTSTALDDLPPGTYCGRARHVNTYGVPSDPSIVSKKTIDAPKPNPPSGFSIG